MIGIARADDTRQIDIGEGQMITVPDIKLPPAVTWTAQLTDHGHAIIIFEYQGETYTSLWWGPRTIGAGTYYVIQAPKKVLAYLRTQLGAANVDVLMHALRGSAPLRNWAKAQGFTKVYNSLGQIVNVRAPLTICGNASVDFDDEEVEDATELPGME